MERRWKRCRDAYSGTDAVKEAGTDYLPFLGNRSNPDDNANYEGYKERALWYNATARTVDALLGMVFRKPAEVTVPESIKPFLKDVTLTGVGLDEFAKLILREVLIVGRCGAMVEMDKANEDGTIPVNPRPWFVERDAEALPNWMVDYVNGAEILVMAAIHENETEEDPNDPFVPKEVEQYRVLVLQGGVYRVDIWHKDEKQTDQDKQWFIYETYTPVMRGKPLDHIPFSFFGPIGCSPMVQKPVILDVADVNYSHYRSSADLEHGRHFTGLPQPWAAGFPHEEGMEYRIGSTVAWVTSEPNAKASFAQVTGGFDSLEKALTEKRDMMASLGARLIEQYMRNERETATAVQMRHGGEAGTIQQICISVNAGIEKLLRWMAEWVGVTDKAELDSISYKLNTDLFENRMDPAEMTSLMALWQSGGISWETLYANLEAAEISIPGRKAEEEKAEIDAEAMGALATMKAAGLLPPPPTAKVSK